MSFSHRFPPLLLLILLLGANPVKSQETKIQDTPDTNTIAQRFPAPDGFQRRPATGFGEWLRRLPLKPERSQVLLYNGRPKSRQDVHVAVVDIDVGNRDLQQCADAVIRLRAEYLRGRGCEDAISFNFTSGDPARWSDYRRGTRPQVRGNQVSWKQSGPSDASDAAFRRYLNLVFTYAGTLSLAAELEPVTDPSSIRIGDVFIQGGSPGHAVLVVDVAENDAGKRLFLLAQSFMPAQEIHVLKSLDHRSPWYAMRTRGQISTPEWIFELGDLRRFPDLPSCPDTLP